MRTSLFGSGRFAALCGFLSSVALGCVITVGDGGKGANDGSCPDDNSRYDAEKDECFCNIGYDWCNDDDETDLACCVDDTSNSNSNSNSDPTGNPSSNSESNTDDTTTNEPTSGTTAEIPTTSEGTTGDPVECVVEELPPGSCGEGEDFLCLQASDAACEVEGSKFYVCTGGVWVEDPNGPNANCQADGFDFGYGCEDNGTMVEFVCGIGPGTPCEGEDTCNGDTVLESCVYGKLGSTDCTAFCMDVGDDMGITYDYGYCGDQRGIACICCDDGDEGCPITEETGGETTTTGGETTTGTTGA